MSLYPVLWKELKDMLRDVRTLAAIALMPLVMMPLLGISSIYAQQLQPGVVVVIDDDKANGSIGNILNISSSELETQIINALRNSGYMVITHEESNNKLVPDLKIVIPKSFIINLTSFNRTAIVRIVKNVASSRADQAINIVNSVLAQYSRKVSEAKVEYLGELSSIKLRPDSVLNPILMATVFIGPQGARVSYAESVRIAIAKLLAFSLIFVTTPSTAYITDSVIGEKERKTFESLLATPVPRWAIITGKILSTSLVGLITGLADAAGLILFFILPSMTYGINMLIYITPSLVITHALAVYLSVLASLAIILPLVIRSGSYRVAQTFSLIVIGVASLVFFMALYVDLDKITPEIIKYILYVIPYTHAVGMIEHVVTNEIALVTVHLIVMLAIIGGLLWLALKLFNEERIIYSKT